LAFRDPAQKVQVLQSWEVMAIEVIKVTFMAAIFPAGQRAIPQFIFPMD
jgi:hypothetical protein